MAWCPGREQEVNFEVRRGGRKLKETAYEGPLTPEKAQRCLKREDPSFTGKLVEKGGHLGLTASKNLDPAKIYVLELAELPGSIIQDTNTVRGFAKVRVRGPLGQFEGFLLVDSGCTMELNLSERKAFQIGLTRQLTQNTCELASGHTSGITCRGTAIVEVAVDQDEQQFFSQVQRSALEVWTDDEPTPEPRSSTQAARRGNDRILADLSINIQQEFSPTKDGKDNQGRDLIIGKPGMLKLGLGINPQSGHICAIKRVLKK